ncbi:MAG: hypothetical protein JWQ30_1141 [Sediminibacterium sp.]|nr:hypothetical protein [Sediminibacterium sp.]
MKCFFTLFSAFLLLACSPKYTPAESVPSGRNTSRGTTEATTDAGVSGNMEESILRYINDYRRSRGLNNLQMNDAASTQAYQHSKNMATGKTAFGHDGFDQRVQNIKRTMGSGFLSGWAENVAYGQLSAQAVVKGWLNSSGHKRNIEGKYNLTGIGTYKSRNGDIYFTQIFLQK